MVSRETGGSSPTVEHRCHRCSTETPLPINFSFQESRRHLGFETQRQWSDRAIHRTTPLLLGLFSLVTLWAAELATTPEKLSSTLANFRVRGEAVERGL